MSGRLDDAPTANRRNGILAAGIVASIALHLAILAMLLTGATTPVPTPPHALVVNLVRLGDKTAGPPAPQQAVLPQQPAHEVADAKPANAVPAPHTPPPPAAQHQADASGPPPVLAAKPTPKPPPEKPIEKPTETARHDNEAARKRGKAAAPEDPLEAQLEVLAQLRQPTPIAHPDPRRQDGTGLSNLAAANAQAASGTDAVYAVRDFIRSQVERRWTPAHDAKPKGDWVVWIHIEMSSDGQVTKAEIVDDPRFTADDAYHDFALSARNAVLISSPLAVPPGEYDIARDITVDFAAKQVVR